ncbi:MAG: 1-(5-phosphoribosyl)-5-[(5-phosphoribosylamino)methylideneamino] imidazole-4-carboxamide isomerase [Acidimicrobiia bacterium]|nr:1-(5-phosphoribosyl)-5-[(5-phosphoribosylamino)methylideneamino] imidazole-4-carboxamide isomerase [Acidimicrobiia bacterium]
MRIFPAIDVLDGGVVRLFQGDYGQVTRYGKSIGDQLEAWKEAGSGWVHVIDLDGARSGQPDPSLWRQVAGRGVRVQLGGGIRSADDAVEALGCGIDRVIMGTSAVWSPGILASMIERVSRDRVVAAVDVRDGRAGGQGWLDEGRDFEQVVAGALDAGVSRFLVTAIARDGAMSGPDLELLEAVRRRAPDAELMAAGGIATMDDLRELAARGIDGAVVGRALYEGGIHLTEALGEFPG